MEVTKKKEREGQGQDGKQQEIDPAIIEELMTGYQRPEDLLGPGGIMEQLTKRLYERVESNEMEKGYQIIRISEQEYRTAISREHKLFAFSTKSIELGSKHGTQNLRWSPAIF